MIKNIKTLRGRVSSNKMQKSAVICVERLVKHKLYGKFIKKTTKLCIHDEKNECNIGDIVEVMESKPISKNKSWKLVKIIKRTLQ